MTYRIVDEPKPSLHQHLIASPLVIFLISILLPMVWTPPLFGRYWMPFLWIAVNSYLLGSPTLKSEWTLAITGAILTVFLPFTTLYTLAYSGHADYLELAAPYVHILNQGAFFLLLYLIMVKQMLPYQLFVYVHKKGEAHG